MATETPRAFAVTAFVISGIIVAGAVVVTVWYLVQIPPPSNNTYLARLKKLNSACKSLTNAEVTEARTACPESKETTVSCDNFYSQAVAKAAAGLNRASSPECASTVADLIQFRFDEATRAIGGYAPSNMLSFYWRKIQLQRNKRMSPQEIDRKFREVQRAIGEPETGTPPSFPVPPPSPVSSASQFRSVGRTIEDK